MNWEFMRHVVPVVFALFGLVFLIHGIREMVLTQRFLRRAVRVPGVVVREHLKGGGWAGPERTATLVPTLRFRTLDGREIQTDSDGSDNPGVGEPTWVLYDPENPHVARADSALTRGVDDVIPIVLGAVMTCGAGGAFVATL